jgi:hypothetical protein
MQRRTRWIVVGIFAGLALSACSKAAEEPEATGHATVRLEAVKGEKDLKRVILSAEAVKRIDVKTVQVREARAENGAQQKVIPYAAVLYDAQGRTWAYANPQLRTFVRAPITVDRIEGDEAILADGPPSGTTIVTVGAEELFGTEFGLFKED